MTKIQPKCQGHHHLSWEKIAHLLTTQIQCSKSNTENKRLRLKILDTVFLEKNDGTSSTPDIHTSAKCDTLQSPKNNVKGHCIKQWCFTTKKGEAVKRKDPSVLTLQHVYDRFCRFSLANASNAAGPRIVAVAVRKRAERKYDSNDGLLQQRVNYTAEQLEREAKNKNTDLCNYASLQCYLRPFEGRDTFYRGMFRLTSDARMNSLDKGGSAKFDHEHSSKTTLKNDVTVQIVDDPVMADGKVSNFGRSIKQFDHDCSTLHKWIQKEVEASVLKIVHHLESVLFSLRNDSLCGDSISTEIHEAKIITLTADFILDDNKQLWLACIDGVRIGSGNNLIDQIDRVLKESNELSMMHSNQERSNVTLPRLVKKENESLNDSDVVQQSLLSNDEQNDSDQEKCINSASITEDKDINHGKIVQTKVRFDSKTLHSMLFIS